ncbi:glycosyltransferase family 2 protein [Patescibacteria group bacterium]|nr:glycosyltransferase family 2 protein [Patescibacteria group bacterium]
MNKISVAIATYNEGKNISKCLESVKSWVDEIVIVDGTSTDDTVKIAKEFGASVISADNPDMFHINKQKAIDACKSGNWILQLDADEVVSTDLKKEIIVAINNQQPITHSLQSINGFWLPRKNFFLGRFFEKGGQYPDYTLRLYRKGKGKLPCKSVHEQAVVEGETAYLKNPLLHYPYPNFAHYLEHFNKYTDIFADELIDKKISISFSSIVSFMFIKPFLWFLLTFVRHKGFVDGFPGFVFSFFSALRYPVSYIKYWEKKKLGNISK